MASVYAGFIPTKMIDHHTCRYWAKSLLVSKSMGLALIFSLWIGPENPVSVLINEASPDNAVASITKKFLKANRCWNWFSAHVPKNLAAIRRTSCCAIATRRTHPRLPINDEGLIGAAR
jgi:hypothetical protein